MNLKTYLEEVKKGNVDLQEETAKILEQAEKINQEYHYLNFISKDLATTQSKQSTGKLAGLFLSVKDNICVQNIPSTAGSKILSNYKPPFHATAVQKAISEGAIIIGKTNQEEFGFGGFGTNMGIGFETPLNPYDQNRATGGSSGGAGGLANKLPHHVAMAESTGGSIEAPAAFCNVFGFCPTYSRVSRYGLIDYANSLDKIGPVSTDLYGAALLLETISGHDVKDSTSSQEIVPKFTDYLNKDVKGLKIGIVKEAFGEGTSPDVKKKVEEAISKLEQLGCKIETVNLPLVSKYGIPTYYLLATTEASTNLAKYCGMRYGYAEELKGDFNDYFTHIRSTAFGKEAKRRIMLGSFARMAGFRDAYYLKAMKVRTKIIQEYKQALSKVDLLITPTMPILPPTFNEIKQLTPLQTYMMDVLTAGPNLAGLPHASVPVGFSKNLPVGMSIIADHYKEGLVFQAAKEFQSH
ncbi:MAG: amidase family protein [Candidatus Nanoarchaeia archaeon]